MIKGLMLLFKGASLGKVALSGGTMLLSVLAYSLIFGWRYAAGFVLLILVHEMGHYFAARRRGLPVGLPTFIPFIGAWTQLKQIPHDAETTAYIAIAGPVAGTVAALACYAAARNTGDGMLLALAYSGFLLNLINMIPAGMLDGGQITAVVSPKLWLLGGPMVVALFFLIPNPIFLLVGLFSWPYFIAALRGEVAKHEYFQVPASVRINYGVFYLGLVAFLGAMTYSLHETLHATYNR
jgi:Zn-dependent protease